MKLTLETGHQSKNTILVFYFRFIIPFSSEILLKRFLFDGIWCLCVPQTILFARNLNISSWQDEKTFLFEINHAKSTWLWMKMLLSDDTKQQVKIFFKATFLNIFINLIKHKNQIFSLLLWDAINRIYWCLKKIRVVIHLFHIIYKRLSCI